MDPLPLNVAKNRQTGFLTRLRRKITNVKAVSAGPGDLELDKLSTAWDILEEALRNYENSQQEVLGLVLEDEVEGKQVTSIEMAIEAAIDKAMKIIRGEFEA